VFIKGIYLPTTKVLFHLPLTINCVPQFSHACFSVHLFPPAVLSLILSSLHSPLAAKWPPRNQLVGLESAVSFHGVSLMMTTTLYLERGNINLMEIVIISSQFCTLSSQPPPQKEHCPWHNLVPSENSDRCLSRVHVIRRDQRQVDLLLRSPGT